MLGDREHNITTTAAAAKLDSVTHLRKMFVCLEECCVCVRDGVRWCICTFLHGHLAARFTAKRLTDLE